MPRHVDISRLRTFVLAASELNFTRTARLLGFSQSAISQQIRELEGELDATLFERRGRTIRLTPAGERLLPLAAAILRKLERMDAALSPFRGTAGGVLRIGASPVPGAYVLPTVLGQFSAVSRCPCHR